MTSYDLIYGNIVYNSYCILFLGFRIYSFTLLISLWVIFVNPDIPQAMNKMKSLVWTNIWSNQFFQALQETLAQSGLCCMIIILKCLILKSVQSIYHHFSFMFKDLTKMQIFFPTWTHPPSAFCSFCGLYNIGGVFLDWGNKSDSRVLRSLSWASPLSVSGPGSIMCLQTWSTPPPKKEKTKKQWMQRHRVSTASGFWRIGIVI